MSETIEITGTDNCIRAIVNNATYVSITKVETVKETSGHLANGTDMRFEGYELELGVWTIDTDGTIVSKETKYVEPVYEET